MIGVRHRPRPVADLVPLEAGRGQAGIHRLVHVGLKIIIRARHLAATDLTGELRAVLDDQGVGGDVVGLERERSIQRSLPIGEGLPGGAVDQVDTNLEARALRRCNRCADVLGPVRAVQRRQHMRHGRLHADREPGDSGVGERARNLIRHRVGVRLDCDLGALTDPEGVDGRFEHPCEIARRKKCRRASAEEDRVHRAQRSRIAQNPLRERDLRPERVGVIVLTGAAQLAGGIGVEVAVAAPHTAERDVQIRREWNLRIDRQISGQTTIARSRIPERQSTGHQSGVA